MGEGPRLQGKKSTGSDEGKGGEKEEYEEAERRPFLILAITLGGGGQWCIRKKRKKT